MQSDAVMNEKFRNQAVVTDSLLLWLDLACVLCGRAIPLRSLSVVSLWAFKCSCKRDASPLGLQDSTL